MCNLPKRILIGSNDGVNCEVLSICETNAETAEMALSYKSSFSIIVSVPHYGRTDGPLPELGHKFARPGAPIQNDPDDPWNAEKMGLAYQYGDQQLDLGI